MAAKLKIDPQDYASRGNAILGIRDSGKTYTATYIAERLFEAGIPFVAFDPIGVWRFLRVPGHGRGYPVVVAGGEEGDLPLTPHAAPAIVKAAMENGVSLVIDLFDINLSKQSWRTIVRDCVKLLIHENRAHGLRHVFIEEAAEFAPQRVIDGDVYAAMEKLARMGGNSRLGYTLINQRAEEVNKALLELCDNLLLHRQKGKNSLLSLRKWLDAGDVKDASAISDSLSTLPQGECWTWMAGESHATLTKVPLKNSYHPDRRTMRGEDGAAIPKAVDAAKFVEGLRGKLGAIEAEAKANDPKALKAELAKAKAELAKLQNAVQTSGPVEKINTTAIEAAARTQGYADGWADGDKAGFERCLRTAFSAAAKAVGNIAGEIATRLGEAQRGIEYAPGTPPKRIPKSDVKYAEPMQAPRASVVQRLESRVSTAKMTGLSPAGRSNGDASLAQGARKILVAIAQHPDGLSAEGITVIVGYRATSRREYLRQLKSAGFVAGSDAAYFATESGLAMLGDFEPLPVGDDLRRYWQSNLSGGELTLFNAIYERGEISLPELQEATGYKATSTREYLRQLRARKLVSGASDAIQLSERLS